MVADLNVHWDKAKDGTSQAARTCHAGNARRGNRQGFGQKNRDWNSTELLKDWREAWSAHVNERMAELGLEGRIDHRSYEAQGIELEPQHKIGPGSFAPTGAKGLRQSGSRITRASPARTARRLSPIPMSRWTRSRGSRPRSLPATWRVFAFRHSDGKEQFDQVMGAVRASRLSWSHWGGTGATRSGSPVARHDRGGGPA